MRRLGAGWYSGLYFKPDGAPNGAPDGGDAGNGKDDGGDSKTVPYTRFQEVVKERNDARVRAEALEAKAREIDEAKLKEKEEWKTLADTREAELKSLQAKLAEVEPTLLKYKEAVKTFVNERVNAWPDEVKAFDPGGDDELLRLEWSNKAAGLAEKLAKTMTPGVGPKPPPSKSQDNGKKGDKEDKPLVDLRRTF